MQRAGRAGQILSPEQLAALAPVTQRVTLMSGHGGQEAEWSGPLLWTVLTAAGAVDPAKPAEQVRLPCG